VTKYPFLTPEQDAEFDHFVAVWQAKLNLQDWRIERGPSRAKGAMASVDCNYGARLATYCTGGWPTPVTSASIEATVAHELLHVLLKEVLHLTAAEAGEDVLESAEHRVINTLEKLLMRRLCQPQS